MGEQTTFGFSHEPELNRRRSDELRDEGIDRVVRRQGSDWLDFAIDSFVDYLRKHGPSPLEEWKQEFLASGGDAPVSQNAWGAVARSASARGLIIPRASMNARSVLAHSRLVRIWSLK